MLRVGIIGYGKMGQIRSSAVEQNGKGEVVAIFDTDKKNLSTRYTIYQNSDEIINDQNIDAVFICTPNHLNMPLTKNSLHKGKHVFCEKPPAFTAPQVQEIIEVEKKSGKKLMYGFNHRHHSSIIQMKSLIDSNEYGKILWMRGRYGKSVDSKYFDNWRANKDLSGGGILLDQGIHMLDLFSYLGGQFDEVKSFISNLYWNLDEIEDNAFVILKNKETGIVASLHSTMTQWRHLFSLEIFLEKGYMVLNGLKTSSGTYGEEALTIAKNRTTAPAANWQDEEKIVYKTDMSWKKEVDHFFDAIIDKKEITIGNSQDALNVMNMVDRIYLDGR